MYTPRPRRRRSPIYSYTLCVYNIFAKDLPRQRHTIHVTPSIAVYYSQNPEQYTRLRTSILTLSCYSLLQDPEAEVRASAAKNVSGFVSLVGTDKFLSDMLPVIRDCCVDTAQNVRVALAESLMEVASHMTHEQAVGTVVPLILQLLKDEAPDVRLKVLETMAKIVDTLGPEFVESAVLPILLSLHGDLLWRVREQILLKLPLLAKTLVSEEVSQTEPQY